MKGKRHGAIRADSHQSLAGCLPARTGLDRGDEKEQPRKIKTLNAVSACWQPGVDDPRLLTSRHIVFHLSRREKSLILLAPLSRPAGGWGLCRDPNTGEPAEVFSNTRMISRLLRVAEDVGC